jgi:hypothetical protein
MSDTYQGDEPMTETMYGARITEIMDSDGMEGRVFPSSFDSDVRACFLQRLTPEEAAAKLEQEYTGKTTGSAGDDPCLTRLKNSATTC